MKELSNPKSGIQIRILKTARDTQGKGFEVEILYPPGTGKEDQRPHFHTSFDEQYEVLSGTLTYQVYGVERQASAGSRFGIPRNTPHLNPYNSGHQDLRIRQWIELEQPDRKTLEAFENFLETGFGLASEGKKVGFLQRVVLLQALQPSSYAAGIPIPAQRVVFGLLATLARALGHQTRNARFASPEPAPRQKLSYEYHFYDRWLIPAPIEQVWESITQTEHYTKWWGKVYDRVERLSEGDKDGLGAKTRVVVHGPLPYRLSFVVESTRMERPYVLAVRTQGDLVGTGIWRLRSVEGGTEVGYDWRPRADFPVVRWLSPLLKPLFRYNHDWCMHQGEVGLWEWFTGSKRGNYANQLQQRL
jgi:mannose-6-phosphate isomerase-like protein (cupin superfamily)